jgi:hypothetical protein
MGQNSDNKTQRRSPKPWQILLLLACLLSALSSCGPGYGFAIGLGDYNRYYYDRYYWDDLPRSTYIYDGFWHRGYCWYEDRWCYEGYGTPWAWDYDPYDPFYW